MRFGRFKNRLPLETHMCVYLLVYPGVSTSGSNSVSTPVSTCSVTDSEMCRKSLTVRPATGSHASSPFCNAVLVA